MAASFNVIAQYPTVQVLSPNEVIDVQAVEFVTVPSGVIGTRLVPRAGWIASGAEGWIAPLAQAIEDMISGGLASYATFVQSVDPGTGLLTDAYEFTVVYDPGDGRPVQSAVATVPAADLTTDSQFFDVGRFFPTGGAPSQSPQDAVRAVYDRLVQTAAL